MLVAPPKPPAWSWSCDPRQPAWLRRWEETLFSHQRECVRQVRPHPAVWYGVSRAFYVAERGEGSGLGQLGRRHRPPVPGRNLRHPRHARRRLLRPLQRQRPHHRWRLGLEGRPEAPRHLLLRERARPRGPRARPRPLPRRQGRSRLEAPLGGLHPLGEHLEEAEGSGRHPPLLEGLRRFCGSCVGSRGRTWTGYACGSVCHQADG